MTPTTAMYPATSPAGTGVTVRGTASTGETATDHGDQGQGLQRGVEQEEVDECGAEQ